MSKSLKISIKKQTTVVGQSTEIAIKANEKCAVDLKSGGHWYGHGFSHVQPYPLEKGEMGIGGYFNAPKAIRLLKDSTPIEFEYKEDCQRIILKNLPEMHPDIHAGVTVIEMEFDKIPKFQRCSLYPQINLCD